VLRNKLICATKINNVCMINRCQSWQDTVNCIRIFKKMNTTRTYWHRNDYLVVLDLIEPMHFWCEIKAWHDIVVLDNTNTNLHVSIFL